jgi:large subunit ribosomal protein L35
MLKTNKSVAKRVKLTAKKKLKRSVANKGHILTKKTRKRKRMLRGTRLVSPADLKRVRRMLPYG